MIDAVLADAVALEDASDELAETFAGQADWDPRQAGDLPGSEDGGYILLRLQPQRIQVWRDVPEHPGRTIMRSGQWLA